MKEQLKIWLPPLLFTMFVLVVSVWLTGCPSVPRVESPERISEQAGRAAEARETLWAALQRDKELFTADEWAQAAAIHDQAVLLGAELEFGLSGGSLPPAADVEEWVLVGAILYADAENLLNPRLSEISQGARTAWAVAQARLRALFRAGQRYLDNPEDAQTYRSLADIGLRMGAAWLMGGL